MKAASGRNVTVKAQATATVDKPSAAQTVTPSSGGGGVRVMIIGEIVLGLQPIPLCYQAAKLWGKGIVRIGRRTASRLAVQGTFRAGAPFPRPVLPRAR